MRDTAVSHPVQVVWTCEKHWISTDFSTEVKRIAQSLLCHCYWERPLDETVGISAIEFVSRILTTFQQESMVDCYDD